MAKAMAVALLAITLLAAGQAVARPIDSRRNLQESNASATGSASGTGEISKSLSDSVAKTTPDASAAADDSLNVEVNPSTGKFSFSNSDAAGYSYTIPGQSHSVAFGNSFGSGTPGSSSSAGVNVGSSNGNVGTDAAANVAQQSGP